MSEAPIRVTAELAGPSGARGPGAVGPVLDGVTHRPHSTLHTLDYPYPLVSIQTRTLHPIVRTMRTRTPYHE
eukprot:761537-Hanusia_phi.AAC.6